MTPQFPRFIQEAPTPVPLPPLTDEAHFRREHSEYLSLLREATPILQRLQELEALGHRRL